MSRITNVELLDLTYEQRCHINEFASEISEKFSKDKDLKLLVKDIFRTKTDESFKVNLKDLAETLEYTGFSPEAVLYKFMTLYRKITEDKTWTIYKNEEDETDPLITIYSKSVNQHIV